MPSKKTGAGGAARENLDLCMIPGLRGLRDYVGAFTRLWKLLVLTWYISTKEHHLSGKSRLNLHFHQPVLPSSHPVHLLSIRKSVDLFKEELPYLVGFACLHRHWKSFHFQDRTTAILIFHAPWLPAVGSRRLRIMCVRKK